MYNPKTTEYVRMIMPDLSPLRRAFLDAVNDFAYETTWPMETVLGEYAGDKYDRDILVDAVKKSIRKLTVSEGARMSMERHTLIKTISDAGLHANTIFCVETAVEEEAIKIIDSVTGIRNGKQRFLASNAHHGRQYLAANAVENIARNFDF